MLPYILFIPILTIYQGLITLVKIILSAVLLAVWATLACWLTRGAALHLFGLSLEAARCAGEGALVGASFLYGVRMYPLLFRDLR